MSHPEQLAFFSAVAGANPRLHNGGRVLEVGARDVNGSVRGIFHGSEYLGVDLEMGEGVDLVAFGHELAFSEGFFDAAISSECFEHDPHWQLTFDNMIRMTRPGGLVAFTCASAGRPEHGTVRTDPKESPGTQALRLDYYRNLDAADFESAFRLADAFDEYAFWYQPNNFDLYFAGIKKGESLAALPADRDIAALNGLMPTVDRIARLPLRAALTLLPGPRYQDAILPYWRFVTSVARRLGRVRSMSDAR